MKKDKNLKSFEEHLKKPIRQDRL